MLKHWLKRFAYFTTVLAIVANVYIFTYPSLFPERCSWRCAAQRSSIDATESLSVFERAQFYGQRYLRDVKDQLLRGSVDSKAEENEPSDVHLLALGDPQIKGIWHNTPYLSRLDIFGNDYYLGHIFSMMKKRLNPTHVAVMGDLFSSQWIGDSEFYNRTMRYTSRIFKRNTSQLENKRKESHDSDGQYIIKWYDFADDLNARLQKEPKDFDFGYEDVHSWEPANEDYLFINLTGNHDIGYSGDATFQHMARFEHLFGKDNYWVEYDRDTDHPWRIVVLNSMLLEGPPLQQQLVDRTWEFLYRLFEQRFEGSTVLLTHVPFYKKPGLCADSELFRYYPHDFEREPYKKNLLRSQNHLSQETTRRVLNLIFDNNKPGIILTGHDHEGCETIYNKNEKAGDWTAAKAVNSTDFYVREITVRSMMGEFDGNAGLVTGHFNIKTKLWEWSFTLCPFSVQHIWWFTKVTTILSGFLLSVLVFM
ncbi:LANO_0B03400g1_1 [Lachancea nothofagi CBS 11611]|uniref:LANO_0B03400g1_1 n=1 Tax=Lachancea nothofagi CBS 11611 TaxID=1266666 RepID=A0A1G4IWR4_9SACH|nr:LANO_0B03400g1_1 [Lachancea nothofagi CBS 11611]